MSECNFESLPGTIGLARLCSCTTASCDSLLNARNVPIIQVQRNLAKEKLPESFLLDGWSNMYDIRTVASN